MYICTSKIVGLFLLLLFMPKKLLIVRHAHAEDYPASGLDFDRKLLPKGEDYAIEMAGEVLKTDFRPEMLYSSPALRAKRTAELFAQQLACPVADIIYIDGIYEAGLYNLTGIINRFSNTVDSIVIVGHNPAFTYLADYLGNKPVDGLPKAGMVLIHFEATDWASLTQGSGVTQWLKSPKYNEVY